MNKISILILSGGLGSRLYPITFFLPKVFLRYKGKKILDYHLKSIESIRDKKVYINLLNRFFYRNIKKHIPDYVKIINENRVSGNGGALLKLLEIDKTYSDILLIYSDTVFIEDQKKIIQNLISNRKEDEIVISITETENQLEKANKGLLSLKSGYVKSFHEKPKKKLKNYKYYFSGIVFIPNYLRNDVFSELIKKKKKILDFSTVILSNKRFKIKTTKTNKKPKDFGDWLNLIKNKLEK